jgi:hypothetical protein
LLFVLEFLQRDLDLRLADFVPLFRCDFHSRSGVVSAAFESRRLRFKDPAKAERVVTLATAIHEFPSEIFDGELPRAVGSFEITVAKTDGIVGAAFDARRPVRFHFAIFDPLFAALDLVEIALF